MVVLSTSRASFRIRRSGRRKREVEDHKPHCEREDVDEKYVAPKSLRSADYRGDQVFWEIGTGDIRADTILVPLIGINTLVILYLLALG